MVYNPLTALVNPLGSAYGGIQELFSLAAGDPEKFAQAAASAGIPPPTGGVSSFAKNVPGMDIGAALTGNEAPAMGGPAPTSAAPTPSTPTAPPSAISTLMQGIKGVKAPTPPAPPQVATPSVSPPSPGVPPTASIATGGLGNLLANLLPQRPNVPPYELPSTLARAIGGR